MEEDERFVLFSLFLPTSKMLFIVQKKEWYTLRTDCFYIYSAFRIILAGGTGTSRFREHQGPVSLLKVN